MEAAALAALPSKQQELLKDNAAGLLSVRNLLEASLSVDVQDERLLALCKERNQQLRAGLPEDLFVCMEHLLKDHRRAHAAAHAVVPASNGYGEQVASAEAASAAKTAAVQAQFTADARKAVVESLFFIYYKTQITSAEALRLVQVLQAAAAELKAAQQEAAEAAAAAELHAYGSSFGWRSDGASRAVDTISPVTGPPAAALQASLLHAATVLQLTLCCALSTRCLLEDRQEGTTGDGAANAFGEGNALHSHGPGFPGAPKPDMAELHRQLIETEWSHAPAQGAAALTWAVFLWQSPQGSGAASGGSSGAFAEEDEEAHEEQLLLVEQTLLAALRLRGMTHWGGAALASVLAARHSTAESFSDLYLDVLAELAEGYLSIGWGDSPNAWGEGILPASHAMRREELEYAARRHGASPAAARGGTALQQQQPQRAPEPDNMEEVLAFVTAVCESCPTFAPRCWNRLALGRHLLVAVDSRMQTSSAGALLQAPLLRLAAALTVGSSEHAEQVHELLSSRRVAYSWNFFLGALGSAVQQLSGEGVNGAPSDAAGAFPAAVAPAVRLQPLSAPAVEVFSTLVLLLRRCMQNEGVRSDLLSAWPHLLHTLLSMLKCAVPPALKGQLFKALGACAAEDSAVAAWLWPQLEALQLVAPGEGMYKELETSEAVQQRYPATEGFLALLQQLVLRNVPHGLGAGARRPGLSPYLRFLLHAVLMKAPGRGYKVPGERWRLTARALQVFATLLRRYPVVSTDSQAAAARRGDAAAQPGVPTLDDSLECDADFGSSAAVVPSAGAAAGATNGHRAGAGSSTSSTAMVLAGQSQQQQQQAQQRCKSAGYLILKEVLSGGDLFFVLVDAVTGGGGPQGLAALRELSGQESVLQVLAEEAALDSPTAAAVGAEGSVGLGGSVTLAPDLVDWSWWKERCAVLSLSILQAAADREESFKERLRAALPSPPALSTFGAWGQAYSQQQQQQQQQQQSGAPPFGLPNGNPYDSLSSTSAQAPLSSVGALLAQDQKRQPLAALAQSVVYTRCAALPLLALRLLLSLSSTLAPEKLLRAVLGGGQPAAKGYGAPAAGAAGTAAAAAQQLAKQYAQRLIQASAAQAAASPGSDDDDDSSSRALRPPAVSSGTMPDTDTFDLDFKTIHPNLIGLPPLSALVPKEDAQQLDVSSASDDYDAAATQSELLENAVRSTILSLLLKGAQGTNRSLTHLLLGLDDVLSARDAGLQPPALPLPPSSGGSPTAAAAATTCLQAVLYLASTPGFLLRESCLAEQCLQLLYALASNKAVSSPLLLLLDARGVNFYPQQLTAALSQLPSAPPAATNGQAVARLHAMAWILRGAALDLHVALGQPDHGKPRPAAVRRLFAAMLGPTAAGDHDSSSRSSARSKLALLGALEMAALDDPGPAGTVPADVTAAARASAVTAPGVPDAGLPFSCIDVPLMLATLRVRSAGAANNAASSGTGSEAALAVHAGADGAAGRTLLEHAARWAIEYNAYATRLCARHHLCLGWRQAAEAVAWSSFTRPATESDALAAAVQDGGSGAAGASTRSRLSTLLQSVLRLFTAAAASARADPLPPAFAEHLSHSCVTLLSCLSGPDSSNSSSGSSRSSSVVDGTDGGALTVLTPAEGQPVLLLLLEAVCAQKGAKQGISERTVRLHLYVALLRYLHETQQDMATDLMGSEGGSGSSSSSSRGLSALGADERAQQAEEAAVIRGEHRLQNMMLLEAYAEKGLVAVLGRDACSGVATVPQCAEQALSLLAAVFSTLGQPPPAVSGLARLQEESTQLRAQRGQAAAARALRSLHSQGHTERIISLAVSPVEAEATAAAGHYAAAALTLLTQLAATEPGALLLLESRVLERLSFVSSSAQQQEGAVEQLPWLRLAQALVASLPVHEQVARQLALLLRAKAPTVKSLLLLGERTHAGVAAAGAAASLLAHAVQPRFYELTRQCAGPHVTDELAKAAVALLIALGSQPYPKGLLPAQRQARCANGYLRRLPAASSGAQEEDWWSTITTVDAQEQGAVQQRCVLPPGAAGSTEEWTLFHAWLLQTSQTALGHAATVFRVLSAAAPGTAAKAQYGGLGAALSACTQVYRAAGATATAAAASSAYSNGFAGSGEEAAAAAAAAADASAAEYDYLASSAAFVVESLLAGLLDELTGALQQSSGTEALVQYDIEALFAPLETLAREPDAFMSKAARRLLEMLNPTL